MKYIPSVTLCALTLGFLLGIGPASAPAQAESILNHLLPSVFGPPDTGPKPEDTLQAPFGKDRPAVDPQRSATETGLMNMYDQQPGNTKVDPLDIPHRSTEQVGIWVSGIVTQALSIDPLDYKPDLFAGSFLPYALNEYNTYLTSNQTMDVLRQQNMKLVAFAEGQAVLVQEGLMEGAYRWVFRVPVMLTYADRNAKTLKGKAPAQTQEVNVNVQISRVPLKQAAEGMMIERWSVSGG